MQYREVECNCGNIFWYWTTKDFIVCQQCGARIPVEHTEEIAEIQLQESPVEG